MQIRFKTPTDGGEAEFLTKFYCDYKKYHLSLRKRTLTSERMNIHRYITALLLLFGCGCALRLDNDSKTNGFRIIKKQIYHVPKNKYYQYEGSKASN